MEKNYDLFTYSLERENEVTFACVQHLFWEDAELRAWISSGFLEKSWRLLSVRS